MSTLQKEFEPNEAWLVYPTSIRMKEKPGRLYFLVDIASSYIFGEAAIADSFYDAQEIDALLAKAYLIKRAWPKKLLFPEGHTAEALFRQGSEGKNIIFEVTDLSTFKHVVAELEESLSLF